MPYQYGTGLEPIGNWIGNTIANYLYPTVNQRVIQPPITPRPATTPVGAPGRPASSLYLPPISGGGIITRPGNM